VSRDSWGEFGRIIWNDELRCEDLPSRDDSQMTWIEFALTLDGYKEKGGSEKCAAFAREVHLRWTSDARLPRDLSDLRSALFFEQRRWRWSAEQPFTESEWRYWHALVDAIRELLHCE
jgi:hypothetical protein